MKESQRTEEGEMFFTREQAESKLREMGYRYDPENFEWVNADGIRGRLAWTPISYEHPELERGKGRKFWLTHPVINGQRQSDLRLLGWEGR